MTRPNENNTKTKHSNLKKYFDSPSDNAKKESSFSNPIINHINSTADLYNNEIFALKKENMDNKIEIKELKNDNKEIKNHLLELKLLFLNKNQIEKCDLCQLVEHVAKNVQNF